MQRYIHSSIKQRAGVGFGLLLVASCGTGPSSASQSQALSARCAADGDIPAGAWQCPDELVVECAVAADQILYVPAGRYACGDGALTVDTGPFAPGEREVVVSDEDGEVCAAALRVVDDTPPVLQAHTIQLWPPNHKLHELDVSECVSAVDACDGELRGQFIWASSDEPPDAMGDGHHAPDIGLGRDAQHACVRAERQGPEDGRVYRLGVRVSDAAGNEAEAECVVIVDHDQRGVVGADSGDAYRTDLDPALPGLECGDGESPPEPDAGVPASDDAGGDTPELDAGPQPPTI